MTETNMSIYQFTHDWFTPNVSQWEAFLRPLAGTPCRLLEIGTFEGRSAFWMADNLLSHSYSQLACIDSWAIDREYGMQGQQVFDANLERCPRKEQILKLSGQSADILPSLTPGYDFAYIDGGHDAREVVTDWILTLRLMKPGGLICMDDYRWDDPGKTVRILPGPAIDVILDFWSDTIEVLHKDYQVWVKV